MHFGDLPVSGGKKVCLSGSPALLPLRSAMEVKSIKKILRASGKNKSNSFEFALVFYICG